MAMPICSSSKLGFGTCCPAEGDGTEMSHHMHHSSQQVLRSRGFPLVTLICMHSQSSEQVVHSRLCKLHSAMARAPSDPQPGPLVGHAHLPQQQAVSPNGARQDLGSTGLSDRALTTNAASQPLQTYWPGALRRLWATPSKCLQEQSGLLD